MSRTLRRSFCPLDCPDSCSLDVSVEEGRVALLSGNRANPLTDGFLCGKVRRYGDHVHHAARIAHPMLRRGAKGEARFERASWDEALSIVAGRLRETRERFGAEAILPFSYGGSNGALTQDAIDARLFRRLGASRLLRTVCAVPTSLAARAMYGGMPGVAPEDYVHARLIVVWGANPHSSGVHLVPHVKRARSAGARLVVVDPRRTRIARGADLHLAPRPGTDLPLALALIRRLFETGRADTGFLERHARGAGELRRRAEAWTPQRAATVCGLRAAEIEAFADLYGEIAPAVVRCGWGLERNRNGGSAVSAVLALPAVAGKFGLRGGGYTMSNSGVWSLAEGSGAPEPPTRAINMNRLGRVLSGDLDPPVRLLFVYDCNPLATMPEQNRVRAGLEREDLFTVVFEQVMTDTARYADVLLPATTFLEHAELKKSYGAMALQLSSPVIDPIAEARPNYAVFAELLHRLDLAEPGDLEDPLELARELVGGGARWERLRSEGVLLPDGGTHPIQFVDVFPRTEDGKVQLVDPALEREAPRGLYGYQEDPATERHPLALISPSSAERISSSLGELQGGIAALEIHPEDARARGIRGGERVRIFNDLGEVRTAVRLSEDLRPGTVSLPKGLWARHTHNGSTANALVPDAPTDVGGGACFNDARVEVALL